MGQIERVCVTQVLKRTSDLNDSPEADLPRCTKQNHHRNIGAAAGIMGNTWSILVVVALLSFCGCQLGKTSPLPIGVTTPHSAVYKWPVENQTQSSSQGSTSSNQTSGAVRAAGTIRGQSPTNYGGQTFGSGNSGGAPMPATVMQAPDYYAPPSGSVAQNSNVPLSPNPYADRNPSSAGAAPNPAYSQPTYPTAPAGNGLGTAPYAASSAVPFGPGGQPNYQSSLAPGATGAIGAMGPTESTLAPGVYPTEVDPALGLSAPANGRYEPPIRDVPIDVYAREARTGRIIVGGSVNSELGVAGQVTIDERNFDFRRLPTSWNDFFSGKAFRGGGQNFRAELMPGNRVQRYTINWTQPTLFEYMPVSLSVGGFLFTRQYRDWTEQRLGGRLGLGYAITRDLSIGGEVRMEDVKIFDPRVVGIPELDRVQGSNDLYTARVRLAHDTRDNPFMATEGHFLELMYDQAFGEFDYPRGMVNYSRYFLIRERADEGGRHTLASTWRFGVTGADTPLFENFFAGGYSTMRGFSFRGASPKVGDVQVGGRAMFLGSLEYVFPLTADDMLRGIAFVDYGTVERDIEFSGKNFRVAPGLGLRIAVPALGPAPLAFDFSVPVSRADTDDTQLFSFFMGFTR